MRHPSGGWDMKPRSHSTTLCIRSSVQSTRLTKRSSNLAKRSRDRLRQLQRSRASQPVLQDPPRGDQGQVVMICGSSGTKGQMAFLTKFDELQFVRRGQSLLPPAHLSVDVLPQHSQKMFRSAFELQAFMLKRESVNLSMAAAFAGVSMRKPTISPV